MNSDGQAFFSSGSFDSPGGSLEYQSHSQGQVQRFNNHGGLNSTFGASDTPRRGFSMARPLGDPNRLDYSQPNRNRDERSLSPSGRRGAGLQERQRSILGSSQNGADANRDLRNEMPARPEDRSEQVQILFASPMPAQTLAIFQAMANRCGLEGDHRAFAMAQSEVHGETNRHLAGATAQSLLLQELSELHAKVDSLTKQLGTVTSLIRTIELPPVPAATPAAVATPGAVEGNSERKEWECSDKLRGIVNPLALKLLFSPLLEAYTALENKAEGYLPHSLFDTIKKSVAKESASFIAEHLPAKHQGVEDAADTQAYVSALKEAGKHAREKLHNVLLVGIHDPKTKEVVDIPVPTIKSLVQRVAIRCGTAGDNAQVEAVWAATDRPTRARIAYLRREAARLILKGRKGCESVWGNVDKQLSHLRLQKNENYNTAFYQIIFEEDSRYFNGSRWFQNLKAEMNARNETLDLPSESAILARMATHEGSTSSSSFDSNNTSNE